MKTAVLTGAGGQLGREFLKTLVAQQYRVYAIDLQVDSLQASDRVVPVRLDITDEAAVHDFYRDLKSLALLVNNAGVGVFSRFEERTAQEFEQVMRVNLLGTFLMSQGAVKLMKQSGGGKIVSIGSIYGGVVSDERIYGESGRNNSEVYSATKAGVIHMTKYMAAHFGRYNIQANCISPGGVYNNQSPDFVGNYEYKTPMGRMGSPTDLQSAFKFLIADETTYVNGLNLIVDGGFSVW